jgi:NAD(P) transhydrogenase
LARERRYDALVIGSGPGGEGAAMTLAKGGRRVALVERYTAVGGGCTHWGTIPSKALRGAVQRLSAYRNDPLLESMGGDRRSSFPELMELAAKVIEQQVALHKGFYERNDVAVIKGHASFVGPHRMQVEHLTGEPTIVHADHVVLAPGSRPYRPEDIDFDHPRVRDADTILELQDTPRSLLVYGAGVIGCEYTSIFRKMGVKVDLLNTRDRLLAFLDDEIVDALAYHLRDQGVLIRHNEMIRKVEPHDDFVEVHTKSGKKLRADVLLYAAGRTGNTDNIGLDAAKLEADARGNIAVNESYQTAQKHIYAVGDVVGWPSLASAAYDQGRFAAAHILDPKADHRLVADIPTGIYTTPEISSIGRTERELTEAKIPYEVGHSFFRHLARAQILDQKVGILKLLFHRETLEILGVHCFGHSASEIIHIGQAAMAGSNNKITFFANTTFNYPTMAEAYRVAALNGLNRLR